MLKKIMVLLALIFILAIMLHGCGGDTSAESGPPRFDSSSKAAIHSSVQKVRDSLSPHDAMVLREDFELLARYFNSPKNQLSFTLDEWINGKTAAETHLLALRVRAGGFR
ncbi:hypothetical protein KW846_27955 [Pseudomonas sp. PDM32]|uniref:DUF6694 family lipoprotein n=1 Tax=Pseudomonas sp. PDM32 TaxID=2854768 RepID=UPI001C489218|nr:DUF6694 family lipoprotein [Pseudomonas sp. PDM32]MBV7576559.1 hypothetical protein [Pseudomonas sp. PDM32]